MVKVRVSSKGGGQTVAFPDVCKTPAPPAPFVPIPYPNSQLQENLQKANMVDAAAQAGNKKAKIIQKKAMDNYKSAVSRSSGDEAGTLKGIASATQAVMAGYNVHMAGGSAAAKTASFSKVQVEGKATDYVTSTTFHNGKDF